MRPLLFLLAVLACCGTHAQPLFAPPEPAGAVARDHVIVKFRDTDETRSLAPRGVAALVTGLQLPAGIELKEDLLALAARKQGRPFAGPAMSRFVYARVPANLSPEELIERLRRNPHVEYAELDHVGTGGATTPFDPSFPSQWHHRNASRSGAFQPDIHSPEAWDITTGSSNVVLAVLDTGLAAVSEFSGRVVPGFDFANNDSDPSDDHGHGTAVAGTAAANANNGVGGAGANWKCRIMPLKVLNANNSGFYSWWASAIDWAVTNGSKVINLSAGGSSSDTTLTRAITNAIAHGVVFVTITHNDGAGTIRFPGNLTNCITVGASDAQDRRAGFSNYGPQIDLVAPGTNILTVGLGGGNSTWWGTSFSAPLVSGVAALLCSVRPELTHYQVADLLCAGADDGVGDATDAAGFDPYYGWGRLNAFHSLLLAKTAPTITTTNGDIVMAWRSAPNASNRQPYRVASAPSPAGPWTTAGLSNFTYTATNTTWRGAISASNQFLRVQIRP